MLTTADSLLNENLTTPSTEVIVSSTTPNNVYSLNMFVLPMSARTLIAFLLSICAVLSLMANCITCHVILHSRRLQSTTNYFIIALSAPAMLVTVCLVLVLTELVSSGWILGVPVCKICGVFLHTLLSANAFLLVSIMADRFYAIVLPLSFKISRSKAKNMIAASFIVGLCLSLPMLAFYNELQCSDGHRICAFYNSLNNWSSLALYAVPYALLTFVAPCLVACLLFARIWRFVWTVNKQRGSIRGRVLQRTTNHVPRTKIKTFKLIATVSGLDMLIMTALFILESAFVANEVNTAPSYDPLTLVCSLYFLDGFAKPIMYVCMNSNFRRGCREVLCWSQMRCYRQELYTVTRVSVFGKKNYVTAVDINGVTENRWENPSVFELGTAKSAPIARHSNAI